MAHKILTHCCDNCPFRKDMPFYLTPARVIEIAEALLADGWFPCHKTVDYSAGEDDDGNLVGGRNRDRERWCAGAVRFLEAHDPMANVIYRLDRAGGYDPADMDRSVPVVQSIAEWLAHAAATSTRRTR